MSCGLCMSDQALEFAPSDGEGAEREQFRRSANKLLAEKRRGEDDAGSHCVGLKAPPPIERPTEQSDKPEYERREGCDEQQHLQALAVVAAAIPQTQATAVRLHIAEDLLDLHAQRIQ